MQTLVAVAMKKTYLAAAIVALICMLPFLGYYWGFLRGVSIGMDVTKQNLYSGILGQLSVLEHVESERDTELILSTISMQISGYLNAEDIKRLAQRPMGNVSLTLNGQPSVFDLRSLSVNTDSDLENAIKLCEQQVRDKKLFLRYCKEPATAYTQKWATEKGEREKGERGHSPFLKEKTDPR